MVQQTRRVVESYIFFKLQKNFSPETYIASGIDGRNKQEIIKIFNDLSLPHNASEIDLTVRKLADQAEKQLLETLPDLIEELRTTTAFDVDHIFSRITKDLFQLPLKPLKIHDKENGNIPTITNDALDDSHIKWGHLIALLVFAGLVAVRSVECQSTGVVDEIVSWVTNFFDTELSHWLAKQEGWEKIVDWNAGTSSRSETLDSNNYTSGVRSLLSVGVIAACVGVGALMMAKK